MTKKNFDFDNLIAVTQKGAVSLSSMENVDASAEEKQKKQLPDPLTPNKRKRGRPKASDTQRKRNFNIRIPEDTLAKLTGIAGDIQAETKKRTSVSDIICSIIDAFIAQKEEEIAHE